MINTKIHASKLRSAEVLLKIKVAVVVVVFFVSDGCIVDRFCDCGLNNVQETMFIFRALVAIIGSVHTSLLNL